MKEFNPIPLSLSPFEVSLIMQAMRIPATTNARMAQLYKELADNTQKAGYVLSQDARGKIWLRRRAK